MWPFLFSVFGTPCHYSTGKACFRKGLYMYYLNLWNFSGRHIVLYHAFSFSNVKCFPKAYATFFVTNVVNLIPFIFTFVSIWLDLSLGIPLLHHYFPGPFLDHTVSECRSSSLPQSALHVASLLLSFDRICLCHVELR